MFLESVLAVSNITVVDASQHASCFEEPAVPDTHRDEDFEFCIVFIHGNNLKNSARVN